MIENDTKDLIYDDANLMKLIKEVKEDKTKYQQALSLGLNKIDNNFFKVCLIGSNNKENSLDGLKIILKHYDYIYEEYEIEDLKEISVHYLGNELIEWQNENAKIKR